MTTQYGYGPNELRRLASAFPEELPQLSARAGALIAQWEADRAEAQEIRQLGMRYMVDLASMTARATRAEAALEQARALLAELAACGYECEAGALENNQAYRELAALLAAAPEQEK